MADVELQDLQKSMESFRAQIPEVQHEIMVAVIAAVTYAEAEATPVDTGEARSNWLINEPGVTIAPHDPGRNLGRQEQGNLIETWIAALEQLDSLDFTDGSVTVLQNNVPYMELLINLGYSPQSAADFDERALDDGLAAAAKGIDAALKAFLN